MDEGLKSALKDTPYHKAYHALLWVLALFCLLLAMSYWLLLVGAFPGEYGRFDLMPDQWRILTAILAVTYPVAACGLWMRSRWGIILWFCAGLGESLAVTVYSNIFAWRPWLACAHLAFFVILCGFWWHSYRKARDKPIDIVEY